MRDYSIFYAREIQNWYSMDIFNIQKLEVKNNVPDPIRKATEKGFAKVFTEQSLLMLKVLAKSQNNRDRIWA
jgi:hypothetical protein